MKNIIEKLNFSIELINKRKILQEKVQKLSQYKSYIDSAQLNYKKFKKENKNTTAIALHIICCVAFFVFLILMIHEIRNYNSYANQWRRAYGTSDNSAILMWVYAVLMFSTFFMDIIPCRIEKNAYKKYIKQDNQYRNMCQSKLEEYQKTINELNSLETYMNNIQVCVIPKDYWDNALEISGCIRNGIADTVEDAIKLLPPKKNEIDNIKICQKCGTQNTATGMFCIKCGKKLI